ncbi:MAG: hypothetical protein EA351_08575 [Gemmatimonadales bacterium]|nr:MAG: hypothetical protein EA351_08575 [Gemmatimonadales bacterium]
MSLVTPRSWLQAEQLDALDRIGAEWIAVLPYARLDSNGGIQHRSGPEDGRGFSSGRLDLAAHTIRLAHEKGLGVMLKPHLWSGADWVGHFAPTSEEDWMRFESDYRTLIFEFAALADSLEVEIFVIGTELDQTVRERPAFWIDLIGEVRQRFGGKLTYAANWDGFQDVPFWSELDYIGVDAFFPLSSQATPTSDALVSEWEPIVEALRAECRSADRPVLLTEYGYRSIDASAGPQWEMPREGDSSTPVNLTAQMNAYEALFRAVWDEPWVAGGFLWKWFPDDDRLRTGRRADYTPQHKPVEEVILDWYSRP